MFSLFPPATVPDPIAVTKAEAAFGIHAGDWETSVMLALSPERVRADRLESAFPAFSAKHLSLEFTAATVAWLTRDFQPTEPGETRPLPPRSAVDCGSRRWLTN